MLSLFLMTLNLTVMNISFQPPIASPAVGPDSNTPYPCLVAKLFEVPQHITLLKRLSRVSKEEHVAILKLARLDQSKEEPTQLVTDWHDS